MVLAELGWGTSDDEIENVSFYSRASLDFTFFAALSLNVSRTTQDSPAKCSRVCLLKKLR